MPTKLSALASVLNGEIPVVLIYVKDEQPERYELAKPDEAAAMLAVIEVLNEKKKGGE